MERPTHLIEQEAHESLARSRLRREEEERDKSDRIAARVQRWTAVFALLLVAAFILVMNLAGR